MVVDTSALVALILDEPEAEAIEAVLAAVRRPKISAVTFVEASIILRRDGAAADVLLDQLIDKLDIEVVPVTQDQAYAARGAYVRFGKGNHPARLNLADAFVYALAKTTGQALLFKGADFAQTDIAAVPLPAP